MSLYWLKIKRWWWDNVRDWVYMHQPFKIVSCDISKEGYDLPPRCNVKLAEFDLIEGEKHYIIYL